MNQPPTNSAAAATTEPRRRRLAAEVVCAAALLLFAVNSLLVISEKGFTTDEAFLIPAGYYHLTERDFRPVYEHPPVVKILSAVPLLLLDPEAPPHAGLELSYYSDPQNLYWTFWRANRATIDKLSFWARVPVILLTVLLGALVFVYARRLFGSRAAAFAVALFALEPTVLAHGRVVQTDIPASLGLLLFSFALYEHLRAPDWRRAAWVGAAAGFAVVTKFSMVVLAPVILAAFAALLWLALRRGAGRRAVLAQFAVCSLAALVAINAAYLFRHRPPDAGDVARVLSGVAPGPVLEPVRQWLAAGYSVVARVIPADFLEGIGWQLTHASEGHDAGLLGRYSKHGWWYYFPVAFALKTTVPFLLLSAAAVLWAVREYARGREGRWLVVLVPFALYTALVMSSSINIGVRYYLPAFPFLFIAAGALLDRVLRRRDVQAASSPPPSPLARRASLAAVVAAFAWMGVEAARAFPDYMTYTNQLAAGRPHWWYLSDSNVEWGDDVRALAEYLKARGETQVRASLLNFMALDSYGVGYRWAYRPPGSPPHAERYVAIGASYLNGSINPGALDGRTLSDDERLNLFDEYRHREPERVFGRSIYLYRVHE